MANRRRDLEKEQAWRLVLDAQHKSSLNVREFCRRESISEPSFYAWRRELRKRDGGDSQQTSQTDNGTRKLVPVAVVDQPEIRSRAEQIAATRNVEIVTPAGWRLRLAAEIEPAQLHSLLDVIANRESATQSEPTAC